jgi:hypothetical protein
LIHLCIQKKNNHPGKTLSGWLSIVDLSGKISNFLAKDIDNLKIIMFVKEIHKVKYDTKHLKNIISFNA